MGLVPAAADAKVPTKQPTKQPTKSLAQPAQLPPKTSTVLTKPKSSLPAQGRGRGRGSTTNPGDLGPISFIQDDNSDSDELDLDSEVLSPQAPPLVAPTPTPSAAEDSDSGELDLDAEVAPSPAAPAKLPPRKTTPKLPGAKKKYKAAPPAKRPAKLQPKPPS